MICKGAAVLWLFLGISGGKSVGELPVEEVSDLLLSLRQHLPCHRTPRRKFADTPRHLHQETAHSQESRLAGILQLAGSQSRNQYKFL